MEKSPGDDSQANKSQRRLHKKKKDVMLSPKKPPNAWTAFLNEKLQEVSCQLYQVALIIIILHYLTLPNKGRHTHPTSALQEFYSQTSVESYLALVSLVTYKFQSDVDTTATLENFFIPQCFRQESDIMHITFFAEH